MNQFETAKRFWEIHHDVIMAAPKNEWAIDPYAWSPYIHLTPIEDWLWGDIRQTNSVFYPQWPVAGFFLDFANPKAKVAIECDGAAFHLDKEKDARRDAKLRALGWEVYRLTGSLCRTDSDAETGAPGEAYRYVNAIGRVHGLRRDGPARSRTLDDGMNDLLDAILTIHGHKEVA